MRFPTTILLAIAAAAPLALGLTDYQCVEVVDEFAQAYMYPNNVAEVKKINSTLFSEDVKGTADLSANFDGRELSTEYVFGLFVNSAADPTDPSPFGKPVSYNVTALMVQNNYVSASIKWEFYYGVLDKTVPIQVDGWFLINDQREITQYDLSFRRWAWTTDYLLPQLIPYMAAKVNMPATNQSDVLRNFVSHKICDTAATYCNGTNEQYNSYDTCMSFLNTRETGEFYRMGEDNLLCRYLHVPMLNLRPSVHCPHIGPTGGDMCNPRDYNEIVLSSHFPKGWLAPKYVTPENVQLVGGIQAASSEPSSPLLEILLNSQEVHSWDPTFYATALLGYLLFFYALSQIIWFLFNRFNYIFPTLGLEHQQNIVMYTMNIILTTIALGLQLVATPAFTGRYRYWEVQCLRTAALTVSALYVFELIYRVKMRIPLIAHHFLTVATMSMTVTALEYTQSPTYLISGLIWLFQATTEQPTFLGLMGYRLGWSSARVAFLLKASAIQTFIFKRQSASAIALVVYWALHQNYGYRPMDKAWTAMVFILAIGLLLTQVWGSYVTYSIGRRIEGKARITLRSHKEASETPTSSSSTTWHDKSGSAIGVNDKDVDLLGGQSTQLLPTTMKTHPESV
ncbi:hypothetical protein IAT38_007563 [Cryptococcus sp. DSM 104549]